MSDAPETFDLTGDLPSGPTTTVLQASAGTGKTHAIATLATRFVAEGVPLDEIMLVTFGRAATVELRERVRQRMTQAARALESPGAAQHEDPVIRLLAEEDVADRRGRLVNALANFDAATISTTHGFCGQMLSGLGVAADVDHGVTFVESASDLVTEAVTDLYVQAFGRAVSEKPPFSFKVATEIAQTAVGDPSARLEPLSAEPGSVPDRRRRLAEVVRDEVARRKRRGRIQDYDDLLVHLRDALADEHTGEAAQERIRSRYRIVLVDEFQDTDPVQWEILERTFHEHRTLVLIGDPKQAIYAFRGADVQTYLLATDKAATQQTLGTNWRSDAALIRALEPIMQGVALGDARIQVGPVDAHHQERSLDGQPPLRIRVVTRDHVPPDGGKANASVAQLRPYVARDVARDIVKLLESGATLDRGGGKRTPVEPGDVAVLIQRNPDGVTIRDELIAVGVPVVLTGTTSVFQSEAARDWLTLLTALEQPHRPGLGRAATLTSFVGWSATQLADAGEAELDAHGARLRRWAELLDTRGVAALLEAVTASAELAPRVLQRVNGERHLTDLRHIGQALHLAAVQGELGVASMVLWLRRRIAEASKDVNEERSRRLESDAAAVQIITVHRSKGLEYPIVYAPFLWSRAVPWERGPLLLHDEQGHRVRDVGGEQGPGYKEREAQHEREDADEDLRLAYVALTRARSQVVTWWAPTFNTRTAPLHRMLFGTPDEHGVLPGSINPLKDELVREHLDRLAAGSDGTISVESADLGPDRPWQQVATPTATLAARSFDRVLDLTWARTSYSGLTAGLHDLAHAATTQVGSEAESPGTVDEPEVLILETAAPPGALPSPMAGLPVGASFGTMVHSVLEELDFTSPDLRAALVERCRAVGSERYAGVGAETLAEALLPSLLTPLGPLAGGRRLADLAPRDVLAEMEYEYPLAGGERPHARQASLGDVAALLTRHLAEDDPLRAYSGDLAVIEDKPLRGFIGGFLDAVLRVRDDAGTPRYLVVDYKTNWLGGDALTTWDYRPEALAAAMRDAHYPLQSLLYAVALHRFLRWRQPGYDPEVHLGGTLYLFLRGMAGPETPSTDGVPAGVFSWRPPAKLIVELSDLLEGGPA